MISIIQNLNFRKHNSTCQDSFFSFLSNYFTSTQRSENDIALSFVIDRFEQLIWHEQSLGSQWSGKFIICRHWCEKRNKLPSIILIAPHSQKVGIYPKKYEEYFIWSTGDSHSKLYCWLHQEPRDNTNCISVSSK